MTPEQALQVIANIINQAEFKGTIAQVSEMGATAQKALTTLSDAIKPVETKPKK